MPNPSLDSLENHLQRARQVLETCEEYLRRLASIGDRAGRLQELLAGTRQLSSLPVADRVDLNLGTLHILFANAADWVTREFRLPGGRQAALCYLDGLVDARRLEGLLLKPMLYDGFPVHTVGAPSPLELVVQHVLAVSQVTLVRNMDQVVDRILAGQAVVFVDGETEAIACAVQHWESRHPEEPAAETVIRGPREGFVETLQTNLSLLRRKVRSPFLRLERIQLGELSRTNVVVAYIKGLAPEPLVVEVRKRLSRIRMDGVLESAYVEEWIEDHPSSPFPQIKGTERPDAVAADLLEGRVAILTEGTPFVLVVPTTFWSLNQPSEDYYHRFWIATALRLLRFVNLLIALFLPALYVAATTFNQAVLPTPLLLTVAASREGIPFPAVIEALLLEISFEALREAGVRLPRPIGQAISIVGVLVIGEAAIRAGIVGPPMVIVVSMTGIASFVVPHFNLAIGLRLLRFPLIVLASVLGIFGVVVGFLAILVHLCSLRSFGIPYLWPVAPFSLSGLKDVVLRPAFWSRPPRPVSRTNRMRQTPQPEVGPADIGEGEEVPTLQAREGNGAPT